jgi:type IV pilus assembly protein PilM
MIAWKFMNRNVQPIGLDIGHSSIKMMQLMVDSGRPRVLAAQKTHIECTAEKNGEERRKSIVSAITRMLAEGAFQGKNVISCLPNDTLKLTSLRLPEAETEGLEQVLGKEAAQRFGLDPDHDAIQYMVAGSVRQGDEIKNELILFAADNESIRDHIAMLEEAQLKPVALDIVPCALYRCFERSLRRQEDKERTVVFVDVGSIFTTVVFGRGGEIRFVKRIPIGGQKFNRNIAARLGIDAKEAQKLRTKFRTKDDSMRMQAGAADQGLDSDGQSLDESTRQIVVNATNEIAEELAKEISLCFRYYTVTFRGKRVESTFIAGGEAYEKILLDVLRRQLSVEVEVAQPLRGVDIIHADFQGPQQWLLCEWAVALGLSLKGANGASGHGGGG